MKTLHYLDQLFQWDNLQKSKFYKGLPQVIQKLPPRINLHRIIPCLVKEFVNPPMIPFVLPNVLLIAENCSSQEYIKHVLVHIKPVMKITDPIQVVLIFMQNMDLLLKLTPAEDIKSDVLPMLYRALESDAQQIQELCLNILPTFASLVDYPSMKNALLPRIQKLCIASQLVSVRVNCLLCIGKLLEHLDKWLVLDIIIPFLPQIPSREPAVLMAILGIYKLSLTHKKLGITKEALASKVIPFLMPLTIENGLSLAQFNAMMGLVKEMINQVEGEHRTKLEQLSSVQKTSSSLKFHSQTQLVPNVKSTERSTSDDIFSNLGLEQFLNDIEESANEAKPAALPTSSSMMTFQEKQKMSQQQAQSQRLQATQVIEPKPAPLKIANKSKDVKTSLFDANLSQLELATKNNSNINNNNSWTNTTSWNFSSSDAPASNSFQPSTTTYNQRSHDTKKNQVSGAFDDLLPSKKKIPLNQIRPSTSQPSGFVQSSSSNPSFKGITNRNNNELSADDIMEFLK